MKKVKNEYSKILIKMSLPILMNYLIMTLFEVIDKAIVGNYSTEGFAAIGVAANFIYLVTGALGVLSAAYNIIAAQFWGKNDKKQFNATFKTVMVITIVIGTLIIALSFVGGRLLFEKVYGLKNGILLLALDYFYIASVTVMMNMIIFNFSVYFRNMKNTKITKIKKKKTKNNKKMIKSRTMSKSKTTKKEQEQEMHYKEEEEINNIK